jgi:hypothetical protein
MRSDVRLTTTTVALLVVQFKQWHGIGVDDRMLATQGGDATCSWPSSPIDLGQAAHEVRPHDPTPEASEGPSSAVSG